MALVVNPGVKDMRVESGELIFSKLLSFNTDLTMCGYIVTRAFESADSSSFSIERGVKICRCLGGSNPRQFLEKTI